MAQQVDKVLMIDHLNKTEYTAWQESTCRREGNQMPVIKKRNFLQLGSQKWRRELKVWDIKVDRAVTTEKIDNGSGLLLPMILTLAVCFGCEWRGYYPGIRYA